MFDSTIFDSKSERFKTPWGAVPAGTVVSFTLRPPHLEFTRVTLFAQFEQSNQTYSIDLPWSGVEDKRDLFVGTMETGSYVGLVWYRFQLERKDGTSIESDRYQLTVYDGSEQVPDWFGQGMTYQIFPDRFCRLSVPDPTGMVGGRTVHQNWEEEPVFRPDEHGEVRNRDFFGGSLQGVISKLDDLQALGVETLYFNPIFEAAENHRYGTADYDRVDPMLGCNEDFTTLCEQAHQRGMRVMLDGVFNHVGYVSRYFNGTGEYDSLGAAQSQNSPYYDWFSFQDWPNWYASWWGIYSLPAVEESHPDYVEFITGENGVVRKWLRAGADGWRLDVADELPDSFVAAVHQAARAENPQAQIIGEVWEDGSNKIAYSERRRHIWGRHCDGLMNYPLRNSLLGWLLGGDAAQFCREMETLRENYPHFAFYSAMNSLGTHDTPRILTLLGTGGVGGDQSKEKKALHRLTPEQRQLGLQRLKLGFLVLFGFPGSPTVYYADEVGAEGWEDPFNRRPYPWGQEDLDLQAYVAALGQLRKKSMPLRKGDLQYVAANGALLAFTRSYEGETVLIAANHSDTPVTLKYPDANVEPLLGQCEIHRKDTAQIVLPPMGGVMCRSVCATKIN